MKIIDLSVTIEHEQPVDPAAQMAHINYIKHGSDLSITSMLDFFPGATEDDLKDGYGWAIEQMNLTTHTGTHMDAPYHFHPTMNHGEPSATIDQIPLEWCMGDGVVFDFSDKPDGYVCGVEDFLIYLKKIGYQLKAGDIVLVHTNAMTEWGKPEYLLKGCGIGREATLWLAEQGIHICGTDAWSWDAPLPFEAEEFKKTHNKELIWEGHKAGAECIYCHMEKLNHLDLLPPFGFEVMAFPIKIKEASAGWVRPVAILR